MPIVRMPNGDQVSFPDNMPKAQIRDLIAKKFPQETAGLVQPNPAPQQPQQGYDDGMFAQATSGVNEGIANLLGAPVDLSNLALGGVKNVANKVFGSDFQTSEKPMLGGEHIREMMGGSIKPQTDDPTKQFVRRVGEEVGASLLPGMGAMAKAQKPLQVAGQMAASTLGSGVGAGIAEQVAPDNPAAEMVGQMVGGFGAAGLTAKLAKNKAQKAVEAAVPDVDDLKGKAKTLYEAAGRRGVKAPQASVQKMATKFDNILDAEGVTIGADVAQEYPKLATAQKRMRQYAQTGDMSVDQMQTMRKSLQKAASSTDPDEARMGVRLLNEWKDFVNPMAPEIKMADVYYHRMAKAGMLDQLDELAESKAGQFTGSGYENALRTEYRGLERKLIKGQQKGFTPDEQDAVIKVSRGTPISNTMSTIGRLKPTGPMSAATSVGLPSIIGTMAGGPGLGMGLAAGTTAFGTIGRNAAKNMARHHADLAQLLIRNGAPIEQVKMLSPDVLKALAALLMGQGANQLSTK